MKLAQNLQKKSLMKPEKSNKILEENSKNTKFDCAKELENYKKFHLGEFKYNLNEHILRLLHDESFFCSISRYVTKIPTLSLPTIGITVVDNDEIVLFYNPFFMESLIDSENRGVLKHEFYHVIFFHITSRKKDKKTIWNIATDLAINSIIQSQENIALPKCALIPGEEFEISGEASKEAIMVRKIIASFPKNKHSEWYYENLIKEFKKHNIQILQVRIGQFDNHEIWDEVTEKEFSNDKLKSIIEKAIKEADNNNQWGSVPEYVREELRKLISNKVDWKKLLRRFCGISQSAEYANSFKKINRKYPYIHPGRKKSHAARIAIGLDQSGSISNEMLAEFFGELSMLSKNISFTVIPFDSHVDKKHIFAWRRRQNVSAKRVKCGGTDFDAPTNYVNKNSSSFDSFIILTDGAAAKPINCNVKRAYIISPNGKLCFETNDYVIQMN